MCLLSFIIITHIEQRKIIEQVIGEWAKSLKYYAYTSPPPPLECSNERTAMQTHKILRNEIMYVVQFTKHVSLSSFVAYCLWLFCLLACWLAGWFRSVYMCVG